MIKDVLLPKLISQLLFPFPIILELRNVIGCFQERIFISVEVLSLLPFCVFEGRHSSIIHEYRTSFLNFILSIFWKSRS